VRTFSRSKTTLATVLLVAGFLIPVGPYTIIRGKILPEKLYPIIQSFSLGAGADETAKANIHDYKASGEYIRSINNKILEAAGNLVEKAGANLMWFFALPWLVGTYHHFKKTATYQERLLIPTFVGLNVIFLFLRYCCVEPDLTHRYILPLTVLTIFYIPRGLELLSCWLVNIKQRDKLTVPISSDKAQKFFYVLLIIGLCICLPKLLRPIRIEKQGYLSAAGWLRENAAQEDIIAVPDRRLYFYAERKGAAYESGKFDARAKYIVKIAKDKEGPKFDRTVKEVYSGWVNQREKEGKKVVIYRVL